MVILVSRVNLMNYQQHIKAFLGVTPQALSSIKLEIDGVNWISSKEYRIFFSQFEFHNLLKQ